MNRERVSEKHVGKRAYKKTGYYSGIIGTIERSDFIFAPSEFVLRFPSGGAVGVVILDDIVFVEEVID